MPVLDPSGFQMAVRIVTTDRQIYPLWMSAEGGATAGATSTTDAGLDGEALIAGLPCVESVDIEIGLGMNSKLTIAIATPFDLGLAVLASPLMREGNVIECQVGYPRIGRFMPWISVMAARPDARISPDEGFSATLNGEGGAFIALRGSRTAEYQNKSYVDMLREILTHEGYENIDLAVPDSDGPSDPLYQVRERLSQSAQSDWFFIQYIVRAANCDAWMEPSSSTDGRQTLRILRREAVLGSTPRFSFVMRGNADFEVYFPILEFETQAEGVWLPGAATTIRTGELNPTSGGALDRLTTRADSPVPAAGPVVAATGGATVEDTAVIAAVTAEGDVAGDHLYVSERDPRTAAEVATAHLTESSLRGGGIQATITTIGIPDLFPGQMVGVVGVGVFNGLYLVQKVTHRVSAEEWGMTMELINNATETAMLSDILRGFTPRTNDATPPEPAGDAASGGTTTVEPVEGDG
jgi:hypothetical protein